MIRLVKIRTHERGLYFRDREFRGVLRPGRHLILDPLWNVRVDRMSIREVAIPHPDLDVIAKSGALGDEARVLDLADHERALVHVDGRVQAVLGPGLHAVWIAFHKVEVEVIDARSLRFEHVRLLSILALREAKLLLDSVEVPAGSVGVFLNDGKLAAVLDPGTHAFWKGGGRARTVAVDLREQSADVAGQEIMTADKVSLRLNAVVTFRVTDAVKAVTAVEDHRQALYREAQLALRAVVGTRELDALLADRDGVSRELDDLVRARAAAFGLEVTGLGIKDVILPGDMKELLNKVTEAKKAAEARLITRREEVAAVRMQANTAKLLEQSPMLVRLRELEALESVAARGTLSVIVGEKGLTDRVVKLL